MKSILASHDEQRPLHVLEELEPMGAPEQRQTQSRLAACSWITHAPEAETEDRIGAELPFWPVQADYLKNNLRMRSPTHGWKTPPG
ncbi:MAG: hypothetical protein ACLR0U_10070 [Enterocloster clostridioformis]